jgi:Mg-chelatase subunit ChlD
VNKNRIAASPEVRYTFSLFDADGLITERSGTTVLPPDSEYPVFESRIYTEGRVPTQTFIEIEPADLWLPAAVGRNQFTVTDRQIFDADGTPKLEAKIKNNALTEARKVEVVATIFDAKGNALTSSRTFVDNFEARSEQTAVFTWPEPIAKTVRSCEVPTDVALAIDLSGSMNSDGLNPPEPLTGVLRSAQAFVNRLRDTDQVAVVTFATGARLVQSLTRSHSTVAGGIIKLAIEPKEEVGSTNQGEALVELRKELNSSRHSTQARKIAVLLTDGLATAPDENPEEYALQRAQELKDSGVILFTIGLGEQVDMEFVAALATGPAFAYQAVSKEDVDRIYKLITGSLCEDGAAVIDIVPKTDAAFAPLQ